MVIEPIICIKIWTNNYILYETQHYCSYLCPEPSILGQCMLLINTVFLVQMIHTLVKAVEEDMEHAMVVV